jgi:pilus assembly protein CpaF
VISTLGALQPWLDDPDVEEVMVVAGSSVFTDGADGMRHVADLAESDVAHVIELVSRAAGRRIDLLSPVLDARFVDGSRVCAVVPPVSLGGPTVSVRKFSPRLPPLASFGPPACTEALRDLVGSRANVIVSGATSSGKTTLLSSVAARFDATERIVCAEDTSEVRFVTSHVVRLQTRPAGPDGGGEVTLRDLVRASLRLRPDRLIVGEVRGGEVIDMLLALSSGHRGCWSTVHASSAAGALERLSTLLLRDQPQWSPDAAERLVIASVDAIVHMVRDAHGRRRIDTITRVTVPDARVVLVPVFARDQ